MTVIADGLVVFVALQHLGFLVLEMFWLLRGLELAAPPSYPFVIEASTKVIGVAFFFIPLQLGAEEATYAAVFDTLGLPAAAGVAVAFARRVRGLVVAGIGLTGPALISRDRRIR